jgi:hypothetical protein
LASRLHGWYQFKVEFVVLEEPIPAARVLRAQWLEGQKNEDEDEDDEETKGWSVGAATKQQRSQRANVRDRPA